MKTILFLSNGHGEDDIAGKIIDRLRRLALSGLAIHAWPMVGHGAAYRDRRIPLVGTPKLLPSDGFGTLSLTLFWRDLRAGWLSALFGQMRAARQLREQYRLTVAVGDIEVIVAAVLVRAPFLFVGAAKSAYYSGTTRHNRLEKALLRRRCLLAFPRDRPTALEFERAGIRSRYVGNPMMDDLEGSGETFSVPPGVTVIALLPGSRTDVHENVFTLLAVAAATADYPGPAAPLHFLFAAPGGLDPAEVLARVRAGRAPGWRSESLAPDDPGRGIVVKLSHARGPAAWIVKGRFADVLHRSAAVIGVAGTANEQAVGLGRPLLTFPTRVQGRRFVRMKMRFFGDGAIEVPARPDTVARALIDLLRDPARMVRMSLVGPQRMGSPGASAVIAETIRSVLLAADDRA